jgi:hypothetical protein
MADKEVATIIKKFYDRKLEEVSRNLFKDKLAIIFEKIK